MANRKHACNTRLVAIIATFALVMGLLPFTAFADGPEGETGETPEGEATIETQDSSSENSEGETIIQAQDTTAGLYIGATPGGTVLVKGTAGGSSTPIATIAEGTSSSPKAFAETASQTGGSTSWGTSVELTAVPKSGYTFKGWSENWNSPYATISNTSNTITVSIANSATYVAVFEQPYADRTVISSLSINFTAPEAGQSASSVSAASCATAASGSHSSVTDGIWYSTESTSSTEPYTGTFAAGATYYAVITLAPDTGYRFLQGGESGTGSSPTTFTVSGATALNDGWLYVTNTPDSQWGSAYISFTPTAACAHSSLTAHAAVAATCTEEGIAAYWTCDNCGKLFSDATATTEISAPVKVAALGHDWGEWVEADGKATRTCKRDSSHTETVDIAYSAVSGDGAEWTKGAGDALTFTFKRNVNDDKTFANFKGVKVDGADVAASNYATAEGSLILSFTTTYLETLSVGDHKVTASFEDGEASATFTVKAAPAATKSGKTGTPATGDRTAPMGVMLLAAAMACGVLLVARNRMSARTPTGKHARR